VNVSDIDSQEAIDDKFAQKASINENDEISRLKSIIRKFITIDEPTKLNDLKKEAADIINEPDLLKKPHS